MATSPKFLLTGKKEVKLLRRGPDDVVMGRPVKGEMEEVVIEANVQPLGYRDLMMQAEADRTKEWLKLFSAEEMRTAREGDGGWEADEFVWDGKRFRIMKCLNYEMGVLDHYVAHAARVPLGAK